MYWQNKNKINTDYHFFQQPIKKFQVKGDNCLDFYHSYKKQQMLVFRLDSHNTDVEKTTKDQSSKIKIVTQMLGFLIELCCKDEWQLQGEGALLATSFGGIEEVEQDFLVTSLWQI